MPSLVVEVILTIFQQGEIDQNANLQNISILLYKNYLSDTSYIQFTYLNKTKKSQSKPTFFRKCIPTCSKIGF